MARLNWHTLPTNQILAEQKTDGAGLSAAEATRCLAKYGPMNVCSATSNPRLRAASALHRALEQVVKATRLAAP